MREKLIAVHMLLIVVDEGVMLWHRTKRKDV